MTSYLSTLMFVHALLWMVSVFGGLVSPRVCLLNLFVLLPIIYIVQSASPFHVIMRAKMQHIVDNYDDFPPAPVPDMTDEQRNDFNSLAKIMGIRDVTPYAAVYCSQEDVMTRNAKRLKIAIDRKKPFRHPLSAQGMIIFGFCINLAILRFVHHKI